MDNVQKKIFENLKKSRYFRHIHEKSLQKFLALTYILEFKEGAIVLEQGQENSNVYCLISGAVSVRIDDEFIYDLTRSGDMFGEMGVISGKPSNAEIRAVADLEVIVISSDLLHTIQDDSSHELHHIFYEWFSCILTEKLELTSQKAKRFEQLNNYLNSDLEAARQIQYEVFFSRMGNISNLPLFLKCEFSDVLGGDFYGVFEIDEEHYGILLGDVTGHGTAASLIAVTTLDLFRFAVKISKSPQETMSHVNELCVETMPEKYFVTIFYGVYNTNSRQFTYSLGGHHPGILLRNNKALKFEGKPGMPIGIFDSSIAVYTEKQLQMEPGDRFLLFTDGAFETIPSVKGISRLELFKKFVETNSRVSSPELVDKIYNYGRSFCEGKYPDDFTLMLFEQS
ncbi:MAG: SpoIIE family protein phosphatase [SAR324 cluster bacterium]|nr:SpoIIE family protein phosphatase [SAR324 cluster bacterium]